MDNKRPRKKRRNKSITKPPRTNDERNEYIAVRPQIGLLKICAPHTAGSPKLTGVCMKRVRALLETGRFTHANFLNKKIFDEQIRNAVYQNYQNAYDQRQKTLYRRKRDAKRRIANLLKKIEALHAGHVLGNIVKTHHGGWRRA